VHQLVIKLWYFQIYYCSFSGHAAERKQALSVCLQQYRILIYKVGLVNLAKCIVYDRFSLGSTLPSSKQYPCIHLSPARLLIWDEYNIFEWLLAETEKFAWCLCPHFVVFFFVRGAGFFSVSSKYNWTWRLCDTIIIKSHKIMQHILPADPFSWVFWATYVGL
jgi:hypothetical protein